MNNINNEPSNEKIEDYDGKESKEKRNIVRLVIIICLVAGAIIGYLKTTSMPSDYIGTQENPGINTSKK
ncbi:hypothetical protein [Poseidonibacter ostreae]|jgi:hypothetical protein|uniref:Uncharacterized protein n=1 Tax=Poseidonibacter ostreae TaxID=2654171 RepID=A0A6L4WPR1_9BACT|nr:hypothetical protein [Poseidonibacter ostreae]KAB7885874.1 hypothetical protein GBG19_13320 [Poseidonibacter ostreae]KAB7888334.1 hypothetical protein GA417_00725 [Poseidonibacter ostreae]KAB7888439.1 hypothetical protein GBG18_13040 [Poseidonibacter ostreae]